MRCHQRWSPHPSLGAGGGAVAGAFFGALLGAATGNYDSIGRLAAIGAVTGAAAGFAYGSQVAKKKASYAKQEDFLDFAIAQAEKSNAEAVAANEQLSSQVAALESRYKSLAAGDTKGKSNADSDSKLALASIDKQSAKLDAQIKDYGDCLAGEGYGNKTQSANLRA